MKRKLTSKTVEHLKALGPKRLDVWDTALQGFGVRISPTGRKAWFVMVRPHGRPKRVTIGTYPAISLADARDAAGKIIRDAQLGLFEKPPETATPTLGETIPLFVQLYAKPKNRGWKRAERLLGPFQALFHVPLNEIKRSDVVRALDVLIASGKPYAANRALAAIKKLMSWALDRGMIEVNPIAGLKPPAKEHSRERILTERELCALLVAADAEGYPFGDLFNMLILTGQRRGEVTGMRWSEIDFERRMWTIPSVRSKNAQAHDVPLSELALDILLSVPRFVGSDYVFTTTGTTPISGFGRAKDRLEAAMGATDWRTHDLRRTAASGMARLGVAPHVVEKVLNHRSGIISGVAAVYNRYGYETETREALERWSSHLQTLKEPVEKNLTGYGAKSAPMLIDATV
jgi:integrase